MAPMARIRLTKQDSVNEASASPELGGLFCPICQELFNDPVLTVDGHSYCKRCISEWFAMHDRHKGVPLKASTGEAPMPLLAPATEQPLLSRALLPNVALLEAVSAYNGFQSSWAQLRHERSDLGVRLEEAEAGFERLSISTAVAEEELARAQKEMNRQSHRIRMCDAEIERMTAQVDIKTGKHTSYQFASAELERLKKQVKEKDIELRATMEELARMRTAKENNLANATGLASSELAKLTSDVERKRKQWRACVDSKDAELGRLHLECDRKDEMLNSVGADFKQMQSELASTVNDLSKAHGEIELMRDEMNANRSEVEHLRRQLGHLDPSANDDEVDALEGEVAVYRKRALQLPGMQTQLDNMESQLYSATAEQTILRAQVDSKDKELDRITKECDEMRTAYLKKDDELRKLKADEDHLRKQMVTQTEELHIIESEMLATLTDLDDSGPANWDAKLDAKLAGLSKQVSQAGGAHVYWVQLKTAIRAREKERLQAVADATDLRAETESSKEELERSTTRLVSLGKEMDEKESQLSRDREEFLRLQQELSAKSSAARRAEDELQRCLALVDRKEGDLRNASTTIARLESEMVVRDVDLKGSHVELHNTDSELRTTKHEMQRLAGADEELTRLRAAAEHIAAELEKRETLLQASKSDTAKLRSENLRQDEMLADLHRQLHERDQELFQTDQTMKRLRFTLEQRGGVPKSEPTKEHAQKLGKALRHACATGDAVAAQKHVDAGANPDLADENGLNSLLWAAKQGHAPIVDLLCRAGANKDHQDDEGWTPVYVATTFGHTEVVRTLVEAGADHTIAAKDGTTPLSVAKERKKKDMVTILSRKVGATAGMKGMWSRK